MKDKYQHIGWVVLSAILTGISIHQINFWLIWIALVPFFVVLLRSIKKISSIWWFIWKHHRGHSSIVDHRRNSSFRRSSYMAWNSHLFCWHLILCHLYGCFFIHFCALYKQTVNYKKYKLITIVVISVLFLSILSRVGVG